MCGKTVVICEEAKLALYRFRADLRSFSVRICPKCPRARVELVDKNRGAKSFGGGVALCPRTRELIGNEWPQFERRTLAHGEAWIMPSWPWPNNFRVQRSVTWTHTARA